MRRPLLLLLPLGLLGMLMMAYAPTWVAPRPDVVSVAATRGYSGGVAFLVAALWAVGCVMVGAFLVRSAADPVPEPPPLEHEDPRLVYAVLALVALAYCPWFLAKMGPYSEDGIFLTATHRMLAGMEPYRDFEFLYGPLMLYPAHWFMTLFGYSMATLYAYIALCEVLLVAVLLAVLRSLIPQKRWRWIAFLVLALVLYTALFSPNQSGLRRLPALVALVVLASGPLIPRRVVIGSILVGVQLAYSHDFGIAALGAAGLLYAVLLFGERPWAVVRLGLTFALGALGTWLVIAIALLGDAFPYYLAELRYLSGRFSAGEAAFRFYWTVNSTALFGLLGLSGVAVGFAIRRRTIAGDREARLLLLGVGFALVGLRSGLNRADLWHLMPPFLFLMLAWWLPGAANGFGLGRRARACALSLVLVAATTYGFGLLPNSSWLVGGWVAGARATLTGDFVRLERPDTAAPAVEFERIRPDPAKVEMARYFAEEQRRGRPVLFYATTWGTAKQVGVVKRDFLNDAFLYSDDRGDMVRRFLEAHPEAFVVMRQVAWNRLNGIGNPDALERDDQTSVAKTIGQWLSSPHYRQMGEEARLREGRWDRLVGPTVVERYELAERFGEFAVLAPRSSGE